MNKAYSVLRERYGTAKLRASGVIFTDTHIVFVDENKDVIEAFRASDVLRIQAIPDN